MNYISSWFSGSKAQEESVKSTEQEKSPSAEESSEGAHFSSVINKYDGNFCEMLLNSKQLIQTMPNLQLQIALL